MDSTKYNTRWYENGQKRYEGYLKTVNNKHVWNGKVYHWYKDGRIEKVTIYKDGIVIKTENKYDEDDDWDDW